MMNQAEWDALNSAVAIAEAALQLGRIEPRPRYKENVLKAREFLCNVQVKRPGAYLPSRHPNAGN
jgi:hypothetical protein